MPLSAVPDELLVARCKSGDHAAWCELVERFSRYVYAISVQAYGLSRDDAEEVFQEVFTRTYEHLDRLREDSAFKPWIAQLTRRLAIDRLRAGAREQLTDEELELPDADDTIAELDEALTVNEALSRLPEHCREICDRFFARDESYHTIVEALGLPPGTIASRISRCLDKLRHELEGRKPSLDPSSRAVAS